MLAGYDYQEVLITGSKPTRARPFRAQWEAGNVSLLVGEWNSAYLDELCVFTSRGSAGKYDDRVDATSCGYNGIALEDIVQKVSPTW